MLGAMKIVAFVPSHDAVRARTFFENTLGLQCVSQDQFAVVFDANGIMVRIVNVREFQPSPFTILGWEVPDIEATVTGLQARGVQFERYSGMEQDGLGIWRSPGGSKVAWFKDLDGNVLSVTQADHTAPG
jgi:catechol 2,3-dioxygenase-like lactoylglutathione lyase family enzyme